MKPALILTISFLPIASIIHSQITITSADMPNAGDSIRVSFSTDPIDPTLTGANYTWNFATLNPNAQTVMPVVDPSDFTIPYNFIFNAFNTSYGIKQYTPDSIGGFQPDDAYNYYKETASDLKKVGMGMTINSIPIPIQYDMPDYVYRFPMNYGNIDSCDAHFEFTIPGYGTYSQMIHRVNEVDGWGQLTTPFGTVASLRIKSIIHTRDSIAPEDTSMTPYAFNRPPAYEYKWLSAACGLPYLEIDATDFGGGPIVTNIIYQDIYRPGTFQLGVQNNAIVSGISVYPNPASDMVVIQFSLATTADLKVEIFDVDGKTVENILFAQQNPGTHIQFIPLKQLNLKQGIYVLNISGTGFNTAQKILIQ